MARFRALPYAKALLAVVLKDEPQRAEAVADELDRVAAAIDAVPDFLGVLVTPMVAVDAKTRILDAILDPVSNLRCGGPGGTGRVCLGWKPATI